MSAPVQCWVGERILVTGSGRSGTAAAALLRALGAHVTLADRAGGAGVWTGERPPPGTTMVVTSPGWRPDAPLLRAAAAAGLPVWGEVELGWRLRPAGQRWLAVTGTNGKTTTVAMLAAILAAAGVPSAAAGNIGLPVTEAVAARPPAEVLAVELSSFQLYWSHSLAPAAAAVLNVAADHLDWHGSPAAYTAAKARIFERSPIALANAEDPAARGLLERAPGRRVSFGAGGGVRVEHDWIIDDVFGAGPLLPVAELMVPGPHNLSNALAAAALARAVGTAPAAIRAGLAGYRPEAHRLTTVATVAGVRFVDDSKATNPHAAAAALAAYPSVVWIAGGLNKGLAFDELVAAALPRLRAAVLLGSCAEEIEAAFARHAARLPLLRARSMDDAVREAARLARPGDTVLLAPAAASMDMFRDYAARGDAFVAAVRGWKEDHR